MKAASVVDRALAGSTVFATCHKRRADRLAVRHAMDYRFSLIHGWADVILTLYEFYCYNIIAGPQVDWPPELRKSIP